MPQAIHFESLAITDDKGLWQRLQAIFYSVGQILNRHHEQCLQAAVGIMSRRASNAMPTRYSALNRRSWHRHSALITARAEWQQTLRVKVKPELVAISMVAKVPVTGCITVRINTVSYQPVWASANHDWRLFEVEHG